jgi:hypothetical protein
MVLLRRRLVGLPYPWGCVSENRAGLSLTHRTQQRFDCVVERLPDLLPDVEPV